MLTVVDQINLAPGELNHISFAFGYSGRLDGAGRGWLSVLQASSRLHVVSIGADRIGVTTGSYSGLSYHLRRRGPCVGSAPGVVRYERLKTYILSPTLSSTVTHARAHNWR